MYKVFFIFFMLLSSYTFSQSFIYPLPLKVGNYWNYVEIIGDGFNKFSYSVIDSQIEINNNLYYKVRYLYSIYNPPSYTFLRYDNSDEFYKEYRHQPGEPPPGGWLENGEYFYYKKNAEKGFMWKEALDTTNDSRFPFFYHFVLESWSTNIFGKDVFVKYIETTDSSLLSSAEWWTEEFGSVKFLTDGMIAYLIGCVIDGVAYGDTSAVTGIDDQDIIPNEYYLSQNYPNPFNPTTTIKYSIPTDEKVVLKVYDMLGREVDELVNDFETAGEHTVTFDGSRLSSGVYFYNITAGKYCETKKVVLAK